MSKRHNIKYSVTPPRFFPKPIGISKAAKFSAVEGLSLSGESKKMMWDLKKKGLKGDALRSTITKSFVKKIG